MAEKEQKLFTDFAPVTTEEWEAKINADLKGKDYERAFVWRTYEGFNVRPYYREENLKELNFIHFVARRIPVCSREQKNRQQLVHSPGHFCKRPGRG